MQKLWFILFGIIITTGAFAADLCIKNDAMVVALNPFYAGTANGYDSVSKTWSTRFSYGIISGIGTCATDCTTQGCVATNQNMNVYSTGAYCYCKMLRPALSPWVYSGGNSGLSSLSCASGCAKDCASFAASAVSLRRGLFRSINMSD